MKIKSALSAAQAAIIARVASITSDMIASFAGTSGTATSGTNKLVDNADTRLAGIPSGIIMPFADDAAPTGWLECNGAAISRTTYATLYGVVGTTWGVGNGTTTFNIPDLRGEFLRGWDNSRGIDSARAFASFQDQATALDGCWISSGGYSATSPGASTFKLGTGSITRPRNIAVMYCIKY